MRIGSPDGMVRDPIGYIGGEGANRMDETQWMETIRTLREVEELARDVYRSLSGRFAEDKGLSTFLSQLADDESLHCSLLTDVENHIEKSSKDLPALEITVDNDTRRNVEAPFRECLFSIQLGTITKRRAIDYIVQVEFSEWNAIFLYVVSCFQEVCKSFQEIAAVIQAHEHRIEEFVDGLPEDLRPERDLRRLPRIWEHRFLVVDDQERVRELLAAVLAAQGRVVTAENGEEALEKLKNAFFDVVVSDIEMPVMDGFTFYQRAAQADPTIVRRFLFCSGTVSPLVEELCRKNGIPFLDKPIRLDLLKKTVQDIMGRIP